jgi:hypothetical protein
MPAIFTKLSDELVSLAVGLSRKPRNRVPHLSDGLIVAKVGLQDLRA